MDETSMTFDMTDTRTVNQKCEKTILIKMTDHQKTHFTVILVCLADSSKMPPVII